MGSLARSGNLERPIRSKIRKLFEKGQEQFRHHSLIEKCKELYKDNKDNTEFLDEFKTAVRYCLVYSDKVAAENVLSFVAKFLILLYSMESDELDLDASDTINEDCTFPNAILELLFKSHGASSQQVRLRCLQLLNKILSGMPENSTISDGIWVKLKETVLTRIQDKNMGVRIQAVLTARKLQDPKNANCEIIKAFLFHLNDPSSSVRRAVVSSIAFNKFTIGHVLARTRDVNDNVRRNTYIVFSKVRVLNLTIKYRLTILERGLDDRSAMVRNCVQSTLLINWLENFNKDVLKFLEALDVINCPDIALKVVENIFKVLPIEEVLKCLTLDEETHLVPVDKLTPEVALLWRAIAHFLYNEKREEDFEKVFPSITTFCEYIRTVYPLTNNTTLNLSNEEKWEEVKKKEILRHLLELVKVFDFADEMGRLNLKKLIFDILSSQSIENDVSECLIALLASVIPTQEMFLQEVTEIISEVREPLSMEVEQVPSLKALDSEISVSHLRVKLNELREKEYQAVINKDYSTAEAVKAEIERVEGELKNLTNKTHLSPEVREEKNDPVTVCKCLTMLLHMINYSKVKTLTPTLQNLKDNFVKQCLTSQDLQTQSLSLQILGRFCVLDLDIAKENFLPFILMLSENGDDEINGPLLKSIFDILLFHGIKPFENLDALEGNNQKKNGNGPDDEDIFDCEDKPDVARNAGFILILLELLNCKTNGTMKSIAFEGLSKLLLSGVIYSPAILEKIIIRGFSPIIDNEAEDYIRQVFMVFFPAFASTTPRSQEMIEAAFIPTLRRLTTSELGTPEADINPKDLASFLIEYTKPNIRKHPDVALHVHNNLAMSICHEILKENETRDNQDLIIVYLKSLHQLCLSTENESFINQIKVLVDKIRKGLGDRMLLRYLNEFKRKLEENNHNTLTSIENTLTTTTSENGTMLTRESVGEELEPVSNTARKMRKVSEKFPGDSSDGSECLDSPVSGSKPTNFIPESPEISE